MLKMFRDEIQKWREARQNARAQRKARAEKLVEEANYLLRSCPEMQSYGYPKSYRVAERRLSILGRWEAAREGIQETGYRPYDLEALRNTVEVMQWFVEEVVPSRAQ